MVIKLLYTKDDRIKLKKSYDQVLEVEGDIKDSCSILSPNFVLKLDALPTVNYAYIPSFNRYYYINNIIVECQGVYQFSLGVDVLMSYYNDIKNLSVIIDKQKIKSNANPYINDGSFVVENRTFNEIVNFTSGFDNDASYILVTAGV